MCESVFDCNLNANKPTHNNNESQIHIDDENDNFYFSIDEEIKIKNLKSDKISSHFIDISNNSNSLLLDRTISQECSGSNFQSNNIYVDKMSENNRCNDSNDSKNDNSSTCGIIELLHKNLKKSFDLYNIQFGLSIACDHFTQKGQVGWQWSCGYRNIQMICSSLLKYPQFYNVLFNGNGKIPSISELQIWIENAWLAGFDPEGALHFGGKLHYSSKWIGATECATLLRYFGINAIVVDFYENSQNNNQSNKRAYTAYEEEENLIYDYLSDDSFKSKKLKSNHYHNENHINYINNNSNNDNIVFLDDSPLCEIEYNLPTVSIKCNNDNLLIKDNHNNQKINNNILLSPTVKLEKKKVISDMGRRIGKWVEKYFNNQQLSKPPLYFQHQGHSRTIIGFQKSTKKNNNIDSLLLFDPSSNGDITKRSLLDGNAKWHRSIRKELHTFQKNNYQIVYISSLNIMSDTDRERSKMMIGKADNDIIFDNFYNSSTLT
eukprot:gene8653-11696_t